MTIMRARNAGAGVNAAIWALIGLVILAMILGESHTVDSPFDVAYALFFGAQTLGVAYVGGHALARRGMCTGFIRSIFGAMALTAAALFSGALAGSFIFFLYEVWTGGGWPLDAAGIFMIPVILVLFGLPFIGALGLGLGVTLRIWWVHRRR